MARFKPLKAIRPKPEYVAQVAALPYDVMNSEEARKKVVGNKYSFLHVDKAEIDLPREIDMYDDAVYQKACENLYKLVDGGVCIDDEEKRFYVYRQIMNGRKQTGIVGCAVIDDYINGKIKKHELTRADKEVDRIKHIDACNANTGPIFLTYRKNESISNKIEEICKGEPLYDFDSDGVRQIIWTVEGEDNDFFENELEKVGDYYIADGHHRCACAANVGIMRRNENPDYDGTEEFNFFLAVAFPEDELEIMDYNRVMKDIAGYTAEEFIAKLSEKFTVEKYNGEGAYKPEAKHTFGMYLDGKWYKLTAKDGTFDENDPVNRLDVSILQNNCITPIFGISDPRTDKRIDFVGGIRGLGELERRCKTDMVIAFSMYPTSLEDLMAIADAGEVMPPKSTWFEPKLLSGLFIHKLS